MKTDIPGEKNELRKKNDWSRVEIGGLADEMNEGFRRRWLNRGYHAPRTRNPQAETWGKVKVKGKDTPGLKGICSARQAIDEQTIRDDAKENRGNCTVTLQA